MRLIALPLAILAALLGAALAQSTPAQQSPRDSVRIAGLVNGQLRFTLGNASSTVALANDLAGCTSGIFDPTDPKSRQSPTPLEPRVLDQVQQNARWYIVLQLSQQGNCNVQGMCGASATVNLVWIELNQQLTALRKQTRVVQNCADETSLIQFIGGTNKPNTDVLDPSLEMRNGILLLSFQRYDYKKKVTTVSSLRYDRRAPAQGFKITNKVFAMK